MTEQFSLETSLEKVISELNDVLRQLDLMADQASLHASQTCNLAAAHIQHGTDILSELKAA